MTLLGLDTVVFSGPHNELPRLTAAQLPVFVGLDLSILTLVRQNFPRLLRAKFAEDDFNAFTWDFSWLAGVTRILVLRRSLPDEALGDLSARVDTFMRLIDSYYPISFFDKFKALPKEKSTLQMVNAYTQSYSHFCEENNVLTPLTILAHVLGIKSAS